MQEILSIFIKLVVITISYLLGCVCFACYLALIFHKKDIRMIGSGNVGSSNIGRQLGISWFIPVLALDALKGFVVVLFFHYVELDSLTKLIAMLAVVIGHIWPIQLSFNGGKGLATVMGVALGFNPFIVLGCCAVAAFCYLLISRSNAGLIVSVCFGPVFVWILSFKYGYSLEEIVTFILLALLIIFAHSNNILMFLRNKF